MAELLDQSDIDALLSAVDSGEVQTDEEELRVFSNRRRIDFGQVEIRQYDFRRPERVSKDHMRALQTLHENFARHFGASLSGFLRMIVEVKVASCEQMTYGEFVAGLPNPTAYAVLEGETIDGQICLELSPLITYPIIDRVLGGTNEKLFIPQRPMTSIEERLISMICQRAVGALQEAWVGVVDFALRIATMEANPQIVQLVAPNEVVIVVAFEIKIANRAGSMNLCIPYKVIEPMVDLLDSQSWFAAGRRREGTPFAEVIGERLDRAAVEVEARLAETTITLEDLMGLAVGDIITTDKLANEPAVLCVRGRKKFFCLMGQHRGARAIRVTRALNADDRA